MQELFIIGFAFAGVISLILCVVLLKFGEIIDRFPAGEEERRERGLGSPTETTRISVFMFWIFFALGVWMAFQDSRFVMVGGIALVFGLILFLLTAVLFSLAVLNLMSAKRDGSAHSPLKTSRNRGKKIMSVFPQMRLPELGQYPRRPLQKK